MACVYIQHLNAPHRKINAALSSAVGALADCEIPDKLVLDFGETEYQARLLEAHGKVCVIAVDDDNDDDDNDDNDGDIHKQSIHFSLKIVLEIPGLDDV